MIPLKDTQALLKFPLWVLAIIALNIGIFYFELTSTNLNSFILHYALTPSRVDFLNINTLLPFISSQFIHAGFLHIISNMIFLWVFGNNVEASLGFLFPVFYLLSGIAAGLTQYLFSTSAAIPMLGASGAVAGVLGAYFALYPKNKIKTLVFIFIFITIIDVPSYFLLFYWFLTQLFSGAVSLTLEPSVGGVAFLAHIGGFMFGWLTASLFSSKLKHT